MMHTQLKTSITKHASYTFPWLILVFVMFLATSTSYAQSNPIGKSLFEEGKLEEAEAQFKEMLKSDSKNPEANYYMGRIEFNRQSYGDATKWFEKATKYESDNSQYAQWLGRAFARRAQSASKLKQPFLAKKTKTYFEKAVELDPDNVEAREDLIEYYLQAPGFLGGSVSKAKEEADEIKKRNPIMGHMVWANIYSDQEEPLKVEREYFKAITDYPERPEAYYGLVSFYTGEERYEDALPIANKVVEVDTASSSSLFTQANVLQLMESFEKATAVYESILLKYPDSNAAYYQIARIASISGLELEKGEKNMLIYISSEPTPSENSLKWAHYRLGLIYEHMNQKEQAKKEYTRALKFDKKFDQAKSALKALK